MGNKHPLFDDDEYDEILKFWAFEDKHFADGGTVENIQEQQGWIEFMGRPEDWKPVRNVRFVCKANLDRIEELKKINRFLYLKKPKARRAYYNWREDAIVIKFRGTKKRLFIPCELIDEVSELTPDQKKRIKVTNNGECIQWESGSYLSAQGVAEGRFGYSVWMKKLREKGIINNFRII